MEERSRGTDLLILVSSSVVIFLSQLRIFQESFLALQNDRKVICYRKKINHLMFETRTAYFNRSNQPNIVLHSILNIGFHICELFERGSQAPSRNKFFTKNCGL